MYFSFCCTIALDLQSTEFCFDNSKGSLFFRLEYFVPYLFPILTMHFISLFSCSISPDLQATVFCTGIAAGSQADWDVAFATYTNPNADVSLKSVLLPALACSKDETTLSL